MLHPTYQHLEDRIPLAGLSLLQWAQLFVCAMAAFGLSKLLPLPGSWSLSVAVTVCGLPAAAAIAFMQADFDVRRWLIDALDFRRGARRYTVEPEAEAEAATPKTKKTKKAPEWKSLPDAEKAQYLLDHQTISDRTWTNEPRANGEKRDAFIGRILLV